ncbi:unnamed protein product, partial [Symbiodinium sp. KB8]
MSGSTNSNDSHNGSDEVEQILRLFLFSWKQENWRMWLAPWLTLLLLLVLWILAFWQALKSFVSLKGPAFNLSEPVLVPGPGLLILEMDRSAVCYKALLSGLLALPPLPQSTSKWGTELPWWLTWLWLLEGYDSYRPLASRHGEDIDSVRCGCSQASLAWILGSEVSRGSAPDPLRPADGLVWGRVRFFGTWVAIDCLCSELLEKCGMQVAGEISDWADEPSVLTMNLLAALVCLLGVKNGV